jgi:hypothetical protein
MLEVATLEAKRARRQDAWNDALERLKGYEYLDLPGPFACHGPMGAETLSIFGYDDLVGDWVEAYKSRHEPLDPFPTLGRIDPRDETDWRNALGQVLRANDFAAMFVGELDNEPWQGVLRRWVPRLFEGSAGGLSHGIIRTAHAARAMPDFSVPSELALRELARALGLWAAVYTPLPGHPELNGSLGLDRAIAGLPRPADPWAPIEAGTFSRIGELAGFSSAVEALGRPQGSDDALSDLSAAFCRLLLNASDLDPIPLVHTVTPIGATRVLLPYLAEMSSEAVYAHLWQVSAAIVCGFTPAALGKKGEVHDVDEIISPAELVARAVEHRDPHVLKFAEVCLSEHWHRSDPVYLIAAEHLLRNTAPL